MLGAIREQVRLYPGRGKQLLRGLQQQFPPWQHWWVDGGYRTTLIASLQQELGGTVEPLRPPHALVAGLPHLASSHPPWECSGYSSRVGGGTAGLGRSATVEQRLRALPRN